MKERGHGSGVREFRVQGFEFRVLEFEVQKVAIGLMGPIGP